MKCLYSFTWCALAVWPLGALAGDASGVATALSRPVRSVLATSNLLQSDEFFICGSRVAGMNGRYVLQGREVTQSDPETPVFFREDDVPSESDVALSAAEETSDFRLFRHNGFWMLADVEPWPPETHFRCDPTKTHVSGLDLAQVCAMNQATPPRVGYSPVDPQHGVTHLTLQTQACGELQQQQLNTPIQGGEATNAGPNNFSTRKDEL